MPDIFCPKSISCPNPAGREDDWPIQNWTSEDPDGEVFIGLNWGWDWNWPPLDGLWHHSHCLGICISRISQADADACASRINLECLNGPGGDPTGGDGGGGNPDAPEGPPGRQAKTYYNQAQTCTLYCLDGTPYSATVPAGRYAATSQVMANRIAYSEACRLAELNKPCNPAATGGVCPHMICVGESFEYQLAQRPGATYELAGELPPGITLSPEGTISGIPPEGSNGEYLVPMQLRSGDLIIEFTFWIRVWGFATDTLPNAKVGAGYSAQLAVSGNVPGSATEFGLIVPGSLPPGLGISATGLISGTPIAAGTYDFSVQVIDGCSGLCQKVFSIFVVEVGSPPITQLTCPATGATIMLSNPVEANRFYGPAGTNQEYLDSQAYAAAWNDNSDQMVAAGCCSLDNVNVLPTQRDMTAESIACPVRVIGYGYLGGALLGIAPIPLQDIIITPGNPPVDFHALFHAAGYAPVWDLSFCFVRFGSPAIPANILLVYHHAPH